MLNVQDFSEELQTTLRVLLASDQYNLVGVELMSIFTAPWNELTPDTKRFFTDAVSARLAVELPKIRAAAQVSSV